MKIYHNPRCSKSRETLKLITDNGVTPEIIDYLKTPPSKKEITDLVEKLDVKPEMIIRKGESIYKENYKGKTLTDEEWVDAMVLHPKLMERPIVIKGNKAIIGRPPTLVLELVK